MTDHRTVFVVGAARSGTSWVRSTLGAHPQVVTTTESHVFHEAYATLVERRAPWDVLLRVYDTTQRGRRPVGIRRWVSRAQFADAIGRARAAEEAGASREEAAVMVVRAVLDGYFYAHGGGAGKVLVEKTPTHVFYGDVILERLPGARVVEVVRDGRDVCTSMQQREQQPDGWPPRERVEQIRLWVNAVRRGLELRSHPLAVGRWHVVRYESLKKDPVEETRALLAFAGLAADSATARAVADENDFSRLSDTGEGKHRRKGEVGDWRNHFTPADERLFRELAGAVFEQAGYRW